MAEYLLPLSGYIVCNFDHAVIAVFEELLKRIAEAVQLREQYAFARTRVVYR